jgi:flagellar basal body rod protein FlgF
VLDRGRSVKAGQLDVGEGEKRALRGVQVIGQTAAIAVPGETQQALDAVAVGLKDDPLVAMIHFGDDSATMAPAVTC